MQRPAVTQLFRDADMFIDRGTHGAWLEEAQSSGCRAYINGEPAFRQMSMENLIAAGKPFPEYDYFCSEFFPNGGQEVASLVPSRLRGLYFRVSSSRPDSPFTTVMNWQSHAPVEFQGVSYGHKGMVFERFMDLPLRTKIPLEVAVAAKTFLTKGCCIAVGES
jgi:hypothetical protein